VVAEFLECRKRVIGRPAVTEQPWGQHRVVMDQHALGPPSPLFSASPGRASPFAKASANASFLARETPIPRRTHKPHRGCGVYEELFSRNHRPVGDPVVGARVEEVRLDGSSIPHSPASRPLLFCPAPLRNSWSSSFISAQIRGLSFLRARAGHPAGDPGDHAAAAASTGQLSVVSELVRQNRPRLTQRHSRC